MLDFIPGHGQTHSHGHTFDEVIALLWDFVCALAVRERNERKPTEWLGHEDIRHLQGAAQFSWKMHYSYGGSRIDSFCLFIEKVLQIGLCDFVCETAHEDLRDWSALWAEWTLK